MQELIALEDIFNVMIQLETLGNKHYNEMVDLTDDLKLKALFNKLAEQEIEHKLLYTKYKDNAVNLEQNHLTESYQAYMTSLLKATIKFLDENKGKMSYEKGFEVAIQLEKDTILFLHEVKSILDDQYNNEIDLIIDQEKRHLQYLYNHR